MKEITMAERKELAARMAKLNFYYTEEYIAEVAKAEEEKKKAEAMKESGEFCCMIMTGDWNAHVDLDCMKECCEVIRYLNNEDEDVEAWQYMGIMAMLDQANEDRCFDYSMPQAISDILGIRFSKKDQK